MQLADRKAISLILLVVLAALATASLGLAQTQESVVRLNPQSGCPGTIVALVAEFPVTFQAPLGSDGLKVVVMSDPDGLISKGQFEIAENEGIQVRGAFTVSDTVCRRPYKVTVSLSSDTVVVAAASVIFTTGGDACPRLPICSPVGGVVAPTNKLALVTPYLALVGLIVAVSAVVYVKKRR